MLKGRELVGEKEQKKKEFLSILSREQRKFLGKKLSPKSVSYMHVRR